MTFYQKVKEEEIEFFELRFVWLLIIYLLYEKEIILSYLKDNFLGLPFFGTYGTQNLGTYA